MAIRFYGAIVYLSLVPALYYGLGPDWPILSALLIPVLLVGAEIAFPAAAHEGTDASAAAFRFLPLLYIPLQLAITVWAAVIAAHAGALTFGGLVFSVGITTGVFGMMSAHEMIHSRDRVENAIGVLMLTGMSYRHFRIAHVHGHHRHAATESDPATARSGESYYAFLPRTLSGQFADAWRFEQARRTRLGVGLLGNRVLRDLLVMALVYAVLAVALGLRAVLFFALESAVAIMALELFNYVAHYGLARSKGEPFTDRHSWNASHVVGNALLFNMGRHSDHHRRAAAPYQTLQPVTGAPEFPAGYAGAMLLALIPPLWRSIMDRRLTQLRMQPAE